MEKLSVSAFIALTNQTLEYAYPSVEVEGEVVSFKVNQSKFVFFDLKDEESSVGCFMMVFQLRMPIEDGMKVIVRAVPKLTKWGKFSLTVQQIRPSGEGNLKKSLELLKKKLASEGLFNPERKRALPQLPTRVGVVSSMQAAGYADFMKIAADRWGGVDFAVAHVQVQGEGAADQIIRAFHYFALQEKPPEVLVLVRGGGSADDLSTFNDELLVRAVATSRIPVLTGIGHEIDESLVDLAADQVAATPSNAAQILLPDKQDVARAVGQTLARVANRTESMITVMERETAGALENVLDQIGHKHQTTEAEFSRLAGTLRAFNPENVLRRGYAILRGDTKKGATIDIETIDKYVQAEVLRVESK